LPKGDRSAAQPLAGSPQANRGKEGGRSWCPG
jgi:hypothetical protein